MNSACAGYQNYLDLGQCYLPQPSASADNIDLGLNNSGYPAQPHPIIVNYYYFKELDQALKARRNSLDNLDSVYQRLQGRDSLSEDDKKKLQQELNSIKNHWHNLEELINETHTK